MQEKKSIKISLPKINKEVDSLSNFQFVKNNKNYSPLSVELKKMVEKNREKKEINLIS